DLACGGAGCGMGPGGGGAGGAILLSATKVAALGTNLVTAVGAPGGACDCNAEQAGAGGAGRVAISPGAAGTTNPAAAVGGPLPPTPGAKWASWAAPTRRPPGGGSGSGGDGGAADGEHLPREVACARWRDEHVVLDPDPAEGSERVDEGPVDELG